MDYIYDGANQLVRENNGFTDETVVYEYDEWGNITRKLTYGYTTQELEVFTPAPVTCTLSYNANISNIGLNRPPCKPNHRLRSKPAGGEHRVLAARIYL